MAYSFVLSLNDELKTLNYPISWKMVLWLITCLYMYVIFACKYGFINIHAMNIITSNITTHLRTQSPSIVDYCLDYRTVSFLEFSILKLYNNCSFLCILQTHENTITFDTSEQYKSFCICSREGK